MTEQTTRDEVIGSVNDFQIDLGTEARTLEQNENVQYPIFRFNGDLESLFTRLEEEKPEIAKKLREEGKTREDNTLYAGEKIGGEFLGTVPMYSSDMKENWEERIIDGKKWFYNEHYLFKNAAGKLFGVHASSSLWKLGKISTQATSGSIPTNPKVEITYVGLVVGKELLEQKYGIKIKTGNKAHVFEVRTSKDAYIDEFKPGTINYTRKPVPMTRNTEKLSALDQSLRNFEEAVAKGAVVEGRDAVMPAIANTMPETQQLSM
mgnify:CR=1 FL=1